MHALLALSLGYAIYLFLFFRAKQRNSLAREIAVILGAKLLILFSLYLLFFSTEITKEEKQERVQKLILED
jgi:hypothetical protein